MYFLSIENFVLSNPLLCLSAAVFLALLLVCRIKKAADAVESKFCCVKKGGRFFRGLFSRAGGSAAFLLENDGPHFRFTDSWENEAWRNAEKISSFSVGKVQRSVGHQTMPAS